VWRFSYRVIKLADIPAEVILEVGWLGLLPFITLTKGGKKPEVVNTMIDHLAAAKEFDLLAMARVLGGIVFNKGAEQAWFRRRFTMFQDLIETSWVYQEIGQQSFEKGLEEGIEKSREERLQGQCQAIVSFLQKRFPETLA